MTTLPAVVQAPELPAAQIPLALAAAALWLMRAAEEEL